MPVSAVTDATFEREVLASELPVLIDLYADWCAPCKQVAPIIEQLSGEQKVVAIGETGLDRYWDYAPFELQQDYFSRHIELARRRQLPFVVHCRDAEADVIAQLRAFYENRANHPAMVRYQGRPVIFFWRAATFDNATWDFIR